MRRKHDHKGQCFKFCGHSFSISSISLAESGAKCGQGWEPQKRHGSQTEEERQFTEVPDNSVMTSHLSWNDPLRGPVPTRSSTDVSAFCPPHPSLTQPSFAPHAVGDISIFIALMSVSSKRYTLSDSTWTFPVCKCTLSSVCTLNEPTYNV